MSDKIQFIPKPADYIQWKSYRKSNLWHYGFVLRVLPSLFDEKIIELQRFGQSGILLSAYESYKLVDMREIQPTENRLGEYLEAAAHRKMNKLNQ